MSLFIIFLRYQGSGKEEVPLIIILNISIWKKHVNFNHKSIPFSPICDMCIKLQLEEYYHDEPKVINDIGEYWSKRKYCTKPDIGI